MTTIEEIKKLIDKGFHIFPLQANGKKPHISNFTEQSIRDISLAEKMWTDPVMGIVQPYNIGIATSKYGDGEALLVVDVDTKKNGYDTLNQLELNGQTFPVTWEQRTASGGSHLIYRVKQPVKQGTDVLGKGIDIRSRGGYIVGAGSSIDGKTYTLLNGVPLAEAPDWIVEKCNSTAVAKRKAKKGRFKVDSKASVQRVTDYLQKARPAIEGQSGDHWTFKVVSRCKDLGVSEETALDLLIEHWNHKCSPPWNAEELRDKVYNSFAYGQNDPGADAPESDFDTDVETPDEHEDDDELSPVRKLNDEYSFVLIGGRSTILKKLKNGEVSYMNVTSFHDMLKAESLFVDGKWQQLSDVWMASKCRSTYDSVKLLPETEAPEGVYNLWRGFSCEALKENEEPTADMLKGVSMFKEHMFKNVCQSDDTLYNWLMAYFAHLVQRPWEKPTTALVFKGKKGVGKNALIDRIGHLFKPHYLLTSNKRYLASNFNSHLAQLLLFVLDEAFWSGDKSAEGILKDLVTGNNHLIEQKGREMFKSENVTRVCIIGNEDWLVPSSVDERRFAVFNVGSDRKEDTKFFTTLRECIDDKGGNRLLMKELREFDLTPYNLNRAPATKGLLEQKIESLQPLYQWWLLSLEEGQIDGLDFNGTEWPTEISRNRLREAFQNYAKSRGIRTWLPSAFGKHLKKACPDLGDARLGSRESRYWAYKIPTLKQCRKDFEAFIHHELEWPRMEKDEEEFLFS